MSKWNQSLPVEGPCLYAGSNSAISPSLVCGNLGERETPWPDYFYEMIAQILTVRRVSQHEPPRSKGDRGNGEVVNYEVNRPDCTIKMTIIIYHLQGGMGKG